MLVMHSQSTGSKQLEVGVTWYKDVKEALVISAKENKLMMLFFTGSDWCGWCIKLQNEVLKTPEFKNWAAENVVLVELDFPRNNLQTPEMQNQNNQILQAFGVQGFPTIHIARALQKEGQVNFQSLGSTGYVPGGPVAFLQVTDGIINVKK